MLVKPQRKHGPKAEMNVVPYIDVMLVLLVIFMVTAPMLTQGVKLDLPKIASEALASDTRQRIVTLSVKAQGGYYWNLGETLDTQAQTDQAASLVSELGWQDLPHLVLAHLSSKNNLPRLARQCFVDTLGCDPDWLQLADQDSGLDWRHIA
ncbi:hypothetical protein F2S73_25350 [Pseudomonas syringae pv. actinidiae]|nr:hypothetical protein [Pseudomonas syringae pv. actinidiae]